MPRKRLTVLQVIPAMQSGGAELGALQVAEALVREGHRALVVSEGGRMLEPLQTAGAEHIRMDVASKNPFVVRRNAHRLAEIIRSEGVDIVHARSRAPAWSCLWASRWTQVPFVTTYHSGYSEDSAVKRFYNSVMVKGDKVIAVSNWIADIIIGRYKADPSQVVVIHRAVDPDVFDPAAISEDRRDALRAAWGISAGDRVVLLPGRLARRKGQDNLVRAVAAIRDEVPRFVCILAGEDQGKTGFRETVEALTRKLGVDDIVRLVGHVDDMPAAYSLATVSVSAAIAPEGFQRGMLEAQAMASPVLVSDVGPGVEVVKSPPRYDLKDATGLNFDGMSHAALADGLKRMLSMPEEQLDNMGRQGSAWVRAEYTRQRLTTATLALYDDLASSAPTQASVISANKPARPLGPAILQIVPRLDTGGAEQTTVDIAAAIIKAGGRSIVASEGGRFVAAILESGAEWLKFPAATKNPFRMFANAIEIRRLIRSENISIVHARSRAPAWSALIAIQGTGASLVTTYHGAYNEQHAIKRFYNSVMARSDAVIANSHYTAELIRKRHASIARHLHVVPRGIDLDYFDPGNVSAARLADIRRAWRVVPSERVVLLPARLTWWKGQDVIIKVASLLKARGNNLVYVLAGDTQGRSEYLETLRRSVREHDLDDDVRIVGHCADMPAAYAAADCVVVPSTEPEAFGRTAVEAQAMGKPVIVSDIGATPETVLAPPIMPAAERTGWRVPVRDAEAIADAVEEVFALEPAQREDLALRERAHVARHFSVTAMARSTLGIYDELLGQSMCRRFDNSVKAAGSDKRLDLLAK